MANVNTFAQLNKLTGPTSSTETAIAARGSSTVRATLGVRSDILTGLFDGHPFKLRVVSKAAASGACNFTVNAYLNIGGNTNLLTFTNDILVIGSGAQALATSTGVLYMEATLLWDSATGRLAAHWIDGAGLANIVTTPAIIKTSGAITATNPLSATGITLTDQMTFFFTHTMSANASSSQLIEAALDQV
jgi:hypothetical protein